MHIHTLKNWQHTHDFSVENEQGERRTFYVLILTAITMVVEIIAGSYYGSMALLADGWHMGTHVAAFMIAVFTYRYAKKHAHDLKYAFGTGKVNVLGGFASAIALAVVALIMAMESLHRFIEPQSISYNESIVVAFIGLAVNVASMFLLKDHHHHGHENEYQQHHDHNLKAAYMHVFADAMTSIFAIFALLAGKYFGLSFMDPLMGIVGAIIITRWSIGLLKDTAPVLLDESIDEDYKNQIKKAIESDSDNSITDVHIWRVGANHYAAIISLVTHYPKHNEHYRQLLKSFDKLSHITIEVHACDGDACVKP